MEVTPTLDLDRLNVQLSNVIDAERGNRITGVYNVAFTEQMPGYGVRMVDWRTDGHFFYNPYSVICRLDVVFQKEESRPLKTL